MLTRRIALLIVSLVSLAAPAWATTATDLCAANANPCVVSTPVAIDNNSVLDFGTRELRIASGGALDVGSGTMTIRAGTVVVEEGGFIRAQGSTSIPGGTITIEADSVSITGGNNAVNANGASGGTITIRSNGDVTITGGSVTSPNLSNAALVARALIGDEVGGSITINARNVMLQHVSVNGGREGLGGDLTINALESITITGTVSVVGGDGGGIDLEAGFSSGAGNVVLASTSVLSADPNGDGGFGGTIDIVAHGDGVATGRVVLDGLISSIGDTTGSDVGGGAGGCISITGDGAVRTTRAAASITVAGGGPDGDGGEIELVSNDGPVEYAGSLNGGSAGLESTGGLITVDAFGDATLSGTVTATAGDGGGGEVTVSSGAATVLIAAGARIDVRSTSNGSGGAIALENGVFGEESRTIVVEGRLEADGASGAAAGTIDIEGDDAVRITSSAVLRAAGALGSGAGGAIAIAVSDGPAQIDGALTASGGSPAGLGGLIVVDANEGIVLNAPADVRGFGLGGEIGLSSAGAIDVRGALTASSSTAAGGRIEITSQGDVLLGAPLIVDGVAIPGPVITVEGCTVTVCGLDSPVCPGSGTGILSSLGPEGLNRITGRDMTVVLGTMRANPTTGRNELIYDGSNDSEPAVLGTVTPNAVLVVDEGVQPCPACGNQNVEPPETCDDGNQLDGDGCSATCQLEDPLPGDANNDHVLSSADLLALVQEIFDGDGDEVGMVSAGTFRGGPGADANGDGHVTAADLPAIAELLAQ